MKEIFKTKKGVLTLILIAMSMVMIPMNLLTLIGQPFRIFGNQWLDYGSICLSFIPMLLGDLLAECYGAKKAVIYSSIIYAAQLVMTGVLWLFTLSSGANDFPSFIEIFTQQPQIFIAGVLAYYVGIASNALIMGVGKKVAGDKDNSAKLFARCILSTVVGQLLDNAIFFLIARAPGCGTFIECFDWIEWTTMMFTVTAIEIGYEVILFPLTKTLTKRISRLEE